MAMYDSLQQGMGGMMPNGAVNGGQAMAEMLQRLMAQRKSEVMPPQQTEQPMPGMAGAMAGGGGGGMKLPLFANGPLGQALGSQGMPMGLLALLSRQLGK